MANSKVDHFKMEVRRFDNIDTEIKKLNDSIKPLNAKLKELKDTKKDLQKNICSFMQTNEIDECKLAEGALLFKETKNVVPLNKKTIHENILKFVTEETVKDEYKKSSNEKKADLIFSFIYENREYNENTTLKRV